MARRRKGPHGVISIDKPEGPTSHQTLRQVQRTLGAGRAGHAGTLDPAASGVLVALLGEATKLSAWVMDHDKVYEARVCLGRSTDTLDREGAVLDEAPVPASALDPANVRATLEGFVGDVMQVPPRYSALKVAGKRAMSRVRAGETVKLPPRPVRCHGIDLLAIEGADLELRVHCGKGYYVRALARDLGRALGVPAHLAALRRTRAGPFTAAGSVGPDEADLGHVQPIEAAVPEVPHVRLDPELSVAVRHGRPIPAEHGGERALLFDADGRPLAMAVRIPDDRWRVARGLRTDPED